MSYLIGGPQVSLMVWVVTPSPRRLRGTSSGFTLTATRWLRRPRESSRVLAATATEYWKEISESNDCTLVSSVVRVTLSHSPR